MNALPTALVRPTTGQRLNGLRMRSRRLNVSVMGMEVAL